MKVFHINDTGSNTKLKVVNGKKILLSKSFDNLKSCLRWLHDNSKKVATREAIEELATMKAWIVNAKFKFKIKEV